MEGRDEIKFGQELITAIVAELAHTVLLYSSFISYLNYASKFLNYKVLILGEKLRNANLLFM